MKNILFGLTIFNENFSREKNKTKKNKCISNIFITVTKYFYYTNIDQKKKK